MWVTYCESCCEAYVLRPRHKIPAWEMMYDPSEQCDSSLWDYWQSEPDDPTPVEMQCIECRVEDIHPNMRAVWINP